MFLPPSPAHITPRPHPPHTRFWIGYPFFRGCVACRLQEEIPTSTPFPRCFPIVLLPVCVSAAVHATCCRSARAIYDAWLGCGTCSLCLHPGACVCRLFCWTTTIVRLLFLPRCICMYICLYTCVVGILIVCAHLRLHGRVRLCAHLHVHHVRSAPVVPPPPGRAPSRRPRWGRQGVAGVRRRSPPSPCWASTSRLWTWTTWRARWMTSRTSSTCCSRTRGPATTDLCPGCVCGCARSLAILLLASLRALVQPALWCDLRRCLQSCASLGFAV